MPAQAQQAGPSGPRRASRGGGRQWGRKKPTISVLSVTVSSHYFVLVFGERGNQASSLS